MAEQMQPMPDVPERCPKCGVVWSLGRDVGGRVHTPGGIDCLHRQLVDARAEAERWQAALVAAREAVEAARRDLAEALKRYDERMMAARGEGTD